MCSPNCHTFVLTSTGNVRREPPPSPYAMFRSPAMRCHASWCFGARCVDLIMNECFISISLSARVRMCVRVMYEPLCGGDDRRCDSSIERDGELDHLLALFGCQLRRLRESFAQAAHCKRIFFFAQRASEPSVHDFVIGVEEKLCATCQRKSGRRSAVVCEKQQKA